MSPITDNSTLCSTACSDCLLCGTGPLIWQVSLCHNVTWTLIQYKDDILRPSYLHNGISYTGKTTSLLNRGPGRHDILLCNRTRWFFVYNSNYKGKTEFWAWPQNHDIHNLTGEATCHEDALLISDPLGGKSPVNGGFPYKTLIRGFM